MEKKNIFWRIVGLAICGFASLIFILCAKSILFHCFGWSDYYGQGAVFGFLLTIPILFMTAVFPVLFWDSIGDITNKLSGNEDRFLFIRQMIKWGVILFLVACIVAIVIDFST